MTEVERDKAIPSKILRLIQLRYFPACISSHQLNFSIAKAHSPSMYTTRLGHVLVYFAICL